MVTRTQRLNAKLNDLESSPTKENIEELCRKLEGDAKILVTVMMLQFKQTREDFSSKLAAKEEEVTLLQNEVGDLNSKLTKIEAS